MDLLKRMNNAINYIEENLMDEISFDEAAHLFLSFFNPFFHLHQE